MTGGQWTAVGNCALSIGICLRNFLVHPARTRRPAGRESPLLPEGMTA